MRLNGCTRSAVNLNHQRVLLSGIHIRRRKKPALHVIRVAFPVQTLCFAPRRLYVAVVFRELLPLADWPDPYLGWPAVGASNHRRSLAIARYREIRSPTLRGQFLWPSPYCLDCSILRIDDSNTGVSLDILPYHQFSSFRPPKPARGSFHFRG